MRTASTSLSSPSYSMSGIPAWRIACSMDQIQTPAKVAIIKG
jgi:hypothetical protein